MTTFTGPLTIKKALNSAQFDVEIGASGTTRMTGPLLIGTSAAGGPVAAAIFASGTARFNGPITVGGSLASTQRGYVELVQRATILAINSAGNTVDFSIPSGSDLTAVWISVEEPFASGVVTANRITTYIGGTGVSAASLVSEIAVSASGAYNLLRTPTIAGNHNILRNVTTTIRVFQSMKSTGSAATSGQGILTIKYIQFA